MTEMQQVAAAPERLPSKSPRQDRDQMLKDAAEKSFEHHQIVSRMEGRYRLAITDGQFSGFGAVEVLLGFGGMLYVGGDTSTVAFAHGTADHRARIAWIGGTTDVSYYVDQKAAIGMSGVGSGTRWSRIFDPSVAKFELAEIVDEIGADLEDEDTCPSHGFESHKAMEPLLDLLRSDFSEYDASGVLFYQRLCEALDDGWDYSIGMVTRPAVYYAWAAVRRLHHLLLAEEEEREKRYLTALETLPPHVHEKLATAVGEAAAGRHARVATESWRQAERLASLAEEMLKRNHGGFASRGDRTLVKSKTGSVVFVPTQRSGRRVESRLVVDEGAQAHPPDNGGVS